MVLEAWTLLMGASTELEVDFHVNFLKSLTELLPNYTSEHEVRQMGCVWMFSGDREREREREEVLVSDQGRGNGLTSLPSVQWKGSE